MGEADIVPGDMRLREAERQRLFIITDRPLELAGQKIAVAAIDIGFRQVWVAGESRVEIVDCSLNVALAVIDDAAIDQRLAAIRLGRRRIAQGGGTFTMIKVRSMIVRAESTGVNSTGAHDARITRVGRFIRKFKIDELSQFINVLIGDMSTVGPRPNTWAWGVELYSETEKTILSVRPGITDLSSIVFSDEGDILDGAEHPDLLYNQIIRPWKNRLALWYIANMTLAMDIRICWLTVLAILDKPRAIAGVVDLLERGGADADLITVCRRDADLPPAPPPGADRVETGDLYLGA